MGPYDQVASTLKPEFGLDENVMGSFTIPEELDRNNVRVGGDFQSFTNVNTNLINLPLNSHQNHFSSVMSIQNELSLNRYPPYRFCHFNRKISTDSSKVGQPGTPGGILNTNNNYNIKANSNLKSNGGGFDIESDRAFSTGKKDDKLVPEEYQEVKVEIVQEENIPDDIRSTKGNESVLQIINVEKASPGDLNLASFIGKFENNYKNEEFDIISEVNFFC